MKSRGDKRSSRNYDRKVLVAEESTKSWADSDSQSSSSSSSSSDSEQEEVHCLMADQMADDELSHSFEEAKAKNMSLKSSSIESSSDELEDIDSLNTELSKLTAENDVLKNETSELKAEIEILNQSQQAYDKFNKMSFVKANVIYDCFESVKYDDQNSPKLSDNGKDGIGFSKPESFKPNC
ncbi:hypothetical protein F511_08601 [Dorcoceras hygrometricum]|uniref:Uncharacterized protein n=1 Tax=Dorcoceras hygrometricum TaxID=472368 RepID=A0A2Z7BNM0_9LAMI|nr:hypothetical protein F511_08601 [Dorcoceras hygrometricum]